MSLRFLLEIGAEEIPDWMIEPALENLRQLFTESLTEQQPRRARSMQLDATPRRLVLRASGLERKAGRRGQSRFPVRRSRPAQGAAQGFAKKMGVHRGAARKGADTQRRVLQLQQTGARTADDRHSCGGAARS